MTTFVVFARCVRVGIGVGVGGSGARSECRLKETNPHEEISGLDGVCIYSKRHREAVGHEGSGDISLVTVAVTVVVAKVRGRVTLRTGERRGRVTR